MANDPKVIEQKSPHTADMLRKMIASGKSLPSQPGVSVRRRDVKLEDALRTVLPAPEDIHE